MDFMLLTNASDPSNFWAVRQEKTLALARVLQACAKESGVSTSILCELISELQKCMAPPMTLSGDNMVVASLLKPTGEELGASPTLEEETTLLGEEIKPPQVPGSLPK